MEAFFYLHIYQLSMKRYCPRDFWGYGHGEIEFTKPVKITKFSSADGQNLWQNVYFLFCGWDTPCMFRQTRSPACVELELGRVSDSSSIHTEVHDYLDRITILGLPRWLGGVESAEQGMQETWVGKIPWRRKWQPTLVFLPGKPHRQRSLAGYIQSMGSQRVGHN